MESFSVLMAVQSTRHIPEFLKIKDGIYNYNVSLNPVSVKAVAANVILEERREEFLSRGERLHRSGYFDRPWNTPIDPYLAGFPEGRDGFCGHCHLHRRYCSIGDRIPPMVLLPESSESSQDMEVQPNDIEVNHVAQGGQPLLPTVSNIPHYANGNIEGTPTVRRSLPGELDDNIIVELYGSLSARTRRVVRGRSHLGSTPTTPGSPVASARFVSRRGGRGYSSHGESSLSRPPGFTNSFSTRSTPVYMARNGTREHSPVSVLRLPVEDAIEEQEDGSDGPGS